MLTLMRLADDELVRAVPVGEVRPKKVKEEPKAEPKAESPKRETKPTPAAASDDNC